MHRVLHNGVDSSAVAKSKVGLHKAKIAENFLRNDGMVFLDKGRKKNVSTVPTGGLSNGGGICIMISMSFIALMRRKSFEFERELGD